MRIVQGKQSGTPPPFANLQHRQIVGLAESSSVWGTFKGQIGAVRRMTKHFNGPSVDCFRSRRSSVARHIVMINSMVNNRGACFFHMTQRRSLFSTCW